MTVSDALAYSEDFTNAVDCIVGQNQKQVYVVTIVNDAIGYRDTTASKVISSNRITIADGYRAYLAVDDSPYDGYLNPRIEQLKPSQVKFLTGGQLTTNMFIIGSFCYPYTFNGFTGGLDPISTFQKTVGVNSNTQTLIKIVGAGLPTSSLFAVKTILYSGIGIQEGISYKILCEPTLLTGVA